MTPHTITLNPTPKETRPMETAVEYRERMVRRFVEDELTPAEETMMWAYLRSPDYSPQHIAGMILDTRKTPA